MTANLVWAFVGGAILGAINFAGLWLTVRRLPQLKRPLLVLGVSTVLRLAMLCAGIYLLADGRWQAIMAALLGALVARLAFTGRLTPKPAPQPPEQEA